MTRLIFIVIFLNAFSNLTAQNIGHKDIYGSWCGRAGINPQQRNEIEKLISDENVIQINKWLNSDKPILQTYSVEALIRLKNDSKIELEEGQLKKIKKLKRSGKKIATCSGCFKSTKKIKDALSNINLE